MKDKSPSSPVWWKNTFFVFGFALLGLAVLGLIRGEAVIRDPGQKFETGLVLFYLVGGIAMLVNGWLTHQQALQTYSEYVESRPRGTEKPTGASE
ncbi:hypothetical protein CCB80_11600 [Armatimonadetes bacterium Uphvl-Ar1]|nr:hypothetical protein CCB80_11600 [Armatimonadetes bacterium Uphvl-Ar1]